MAEHAAVETQQQGLVARWRQTEPLRLWLYGIAVPLLALLVGYGVLTTGLAGLWLAVAAGVLLGAGTEGARQFTVSPATARAAVLESARGTTNVTMQGILRGWDPRVEHPDDLHIIPEQEARQVLIRYRIPS